MPGYPCWASLRRAKELRTVAISVMLCEVTTRRICGDSREKDRQV
ncbi:hypothetical protein [Pyrolobus fumarii]|nr:hypothetical protein [Pyrolobus fumarii]